MMQNLRDPALKARASADAQVGTQRAVRTWLYVKASYLPHRLLDDYDAVVEATCGAWR